MAEKIEALVEAGKASAGPPIGSSLGPLGVNISQVVSEINKRTEPFKGMKVPVTILVNKDKTFSISIGTPPVSQLIKKEIGLDKGAGTPQIDKKGNLAIEQTIKIAKMKKDSMFDNNLKNAIKSIAGSANSMGVLVEGLTSVELNSEIDNGRFDLEIQQEKTELSEERKDFLANQLKEVQNRLKKEQEKLKAMEEAEKPKAPKEEAKEEKKEEKKEAVKEETKEKPIEKKTPEKKEEKQK